MWAQSTHDSFVYVTRLTHEGKSGETRRGKHTREHTKRELEEPDRRENVNIWGFR